MVIANNIECNYKRLCQCEKKNGKGSKYNNTMTMAK